MAKWKSTKGQTTMFVLILYFALEGFMFYWCFLYLFTYNDV